MGIEETLDLMNDILDNAWSFPLSGNKSIVDVQKINNLIDDIRLNLPTEVKQAKLIVADRAGIFAEARREADTIVRRAEDRAKVLVENEEIVKKAQVRANEIVTVAQTKAKELKQATNEFVDNMLKTTEESFTKNLQEIKATRQAVRSVR